MNIFSKIVGQNPKTLLGKAMEKFKKEIGPLSFIVYMTPLIILCIIFEVNNPGTPIPHLYSFFIIWYFIALYLLNKINSEIIQMIICLPKYYFIKIN